MLYLVHDACPQLCRMAAVQLTIIEITTILYNNLDTKITNGHAQKGQFGHLILGYYRLHQYCCPLLQRNFNQVPVTFVSFAARYIRKLIVVYVCMTNHADKLFYENKRSPIVGIGHKMTVSFPRNHLKMRIRFYGCLLF